MNYISANEIKLFIEEINKFDLKNKSNLTEEEKEFIKVCIEIINSNQKNTIIKKDEFKNKSIKIKEKFKTEYGSVNKKTDNIFNTKIHDVNVEKDDIKTFHQPSSSIKEIAIYSKKKRNIITRIFISLGSLLKSIFCFGNKKSLADKKIIPVSQSTPVNKVEPVIIKTIIDTPLLNSSKPIEASQFAWHLNLGLMRSAYESTNDPQLKEQIQFMATNYLDKTAPIRPKQTRKVVPEFDSIFQTGPFSDNDSYHRLAFTEKMKYSLSINKKLGLGEKSPLVLTDTEKFQSLFPLSFKVMNEQQKENELRKELSSVFLSHFNNFKNEPLKGIRNQLEFGLMFDLTDVLKPYIYTNENKEKENKFELKLNEFKKKLNQWVDHAVDDVTKAYPDLFKNELEKKKVKLFIQKNITVISRVKINENMGGLKILPIFNKLEKKELRKTHSHLMEFIDHSGIFLGAVKLRRYVMKGFEVRKDIHYAVNGKDALYYSKKTDFTNSALFNRLSKKFGSADLMKKKPHLAILGHSTIKLIAGLMENIDQNKWDVLNANSATCKILQTTLYQLKEQLATAELWMNDYRKFAQAIELAQAELATLLELINPFKVTEFSSTYKEQLKKVVPSTLMPFLKASLGKTAVNTVAGINAAVLKDNPHPNRCYSEGFYYESASIVGWNHEFKKIINDPKIKNIDLYCCQAYPNIQIEPNYTHYKSVDIVDNVKEILKKKSETKKLTVAVDCTIDYLNSPEVKKILSNFKNEIKNGKLNFIFFHSGQKFDMLGMDNYFGSPFYMINNGDKKWESFNSLLNNDVHKTDGLSSQWFNLSHRYAAHLIDEYRKMIFENTKYILKNVPKSLKPNLKIKQKIRVNTIDNKMQPSFIDIKVSGPDHVEKTKELIALFYKKCSENKIKAFKKPSFGFYHPNVTYIPNSSTSTSIRINPGLNPEENETIIEYLNEISRMK